MKRIALAVLAVLALSGCGQETGQENETHVIVVDTEQGPVECVVWDAYRSGGIDCNFITPENPG